MLPQRYVELGLLLTGLAESLDLTDTQYQTAVKHYTAVGEWLDREDSPTGLLQTVVYPQGSFRLGTMVKPINDNDEYDIDLVCEVQKLDKTRTTQQRLKALVGDRLKANGTYAQMLTEGSRCWTLTYADSTHFHLDILPAIPDVDVRSHTGTFDSRAILITDKKLLHWQTSNPIGYADWFKDRMRMQFNSRRKLLAESIRASVDDVPEYRVKTTLQRSIQLLKRHRDVMFQEDQEDRPISIIITTLAALAYENEGHLVDALQNMARRIPALIQKNDRGNAVIVNPVDPRENFADKWLEFPQRQKKFMDWIQQVQEDIEAALRAPSLGNMTDDLKARFGDRAVNVTASKVFPRHYNASRTALVAVPRVSINKPSKPWGRIS